MAAFGHETESIFIDFEETLNSIFVSAKMLATHYWQRQDCIQMEEEEFKGHLEEMHQHEGVFWDRIKDDDEIRNKLKDIQIRLEAVTKPCFEEPMKSYELLTKRWFKKGLTMAIVRDLPSAVFVCAMNSTCLSPLRQGPHRKR